MDDILDFLTRNSDSLIAGVVSSLIVIALQVTAMAASATIAYFVTRRLSIRRTFRLGLTKSSKRAYVISGTLGHQSNPQLAVLMGPDASAAAHVISALEDAYPDVEIKHTFCNNTGESIYDENFVAIGGPLFNACAKEILAFYRNVIWFDDQEVIHVGTETFAQEPDGGQAGNAVDYGIILRACSRWNPKKRVMLIAGIGSIGVLAASYAVTRKEKYPTLMRDIRRRIGWWKAIRNEDFVAIVKCEGFANDASSLEIVYATALASLMPPKVNSRRQLTIAVPTADQPAALQE